MAIKSKQYVNIKGIELLQHFGYEGIKMNMGGVKRLFCSCGEAYTKIDGACLNCGNTNFINYESNYNQKKTIDDGVFLNHEKVKDIFSSTEFKRVVYDLGLYISRDLIEIKYSEPRTHWELGEDFFYHEDFDSEKRFGRSRTDNVSKQLIVERFFAYEKNKDFIDIFPDDERIIHNMITLNEFILSTTLDKDFIFDNIKFFLITKGNIKKIIGNEDTYLDSFDIPDSFRHDLNKVETKYDYYGLDFTHSGGYRYKEFIDRWDKIDDSLKEMLIYCYDHEILSYSDIQEISSHIGKYYSAKEGTIKSSSNNYYYSDRNIEVYNAISKDLFNQFFEDNLFNFKVNTVTYLLERVNFCLLYNFEVNLENLETKQFKRNYNMKKLKENKMPEEKINLFIELIDSDPLKAISLIQSRRKLTKKQKAEFNIT